MTITAEPQAHYGLSEEHEALRESVRDFAETVVAPRAAEVDRTATYPWDVHEALRKNELLALHVGEAYGGAGADAISTAIVIEELSRVDASVGLVVAVNKLGTTGLLLSGSEELKSRYLPQVASGEATFSYALSEREAGSDAAAMRTRAVRDGDSYVLNGTKCWITGAGVSTHYTVMAVTDPDKGANGISAFVVAKDDPGFSVGTKERKLGIKGSPTCEVYFQDCRVPASRMIGATKQRQQFGKRIADFQGVQFMLADMAMKVEAARQLVYVAAASAERGDPDLTFLSSASKTFASDTAMEVTTNALQLLGGYGYTKDFPVERMMRDAKITQIYEGTNQVQRMV